MKFDFTKLKILINISLRNLLRQRRRNLLLGIAIAFGMMILVMAYSFSHGIADNLFNRIIVWATGHVEVAGMEKGKYNTSIIRDKERIENIIKKNVKNMRFIQESIASFTRALGNGKAETVIIVGIDYNLPPDAGEGTWEIIAGNEADMTNGQYEFPMILYEDKAKDLNVKVGDIVRARLETIYGQQQSARFTIVALVKTEGMFQSMAAMTTIQALKPLLGYQPYEAGGLQIILKNPKKDAYPIAEKLYHALKPNIAYIYGDLSRGNLHKKCFALAYYKASASVNILTNQIKLIHNQWKNILPNETVLMNENLQKELNVQRGDQIKLEYATKFGNKKIVNTYTIAGFFKAKGMLPSNSILLHENKFFDTYYENLPNTYSKESELFTSLTNNALAPALVKEWYLFQRSSTHEAMEKKYSDLTRNKFKGAAMDVRTMYETASQIVQLENALYIITFVAVLILFFIILIGVINTMRMSIRERTREIGTMRAIGMQKKDIKNTFILETFFLSLIACITGTIFAFIIMYLISLIKINTTSPLSMLLVNKHLYFAPTFGGLLTNLILILIISIATAYFPAKRASNLPPAGALRHYE